MSARWLEITIDASADSADDVRAVMARWAGSAVAIEQPAPDGESGDACRVVAYLPDSEELPVTKYELFEALWHLGRLGSDVADYPTERWTDEGEWHTRWKEFYRPQVIGGIVVVPAWEETPPSNGLVVRIDPGMAFGTGLHATTRQAILALQEVECRGKRVVDLGTGSGVLAITAARLGAVAVTALDTDVHAVEAARSNVEINCVDDLVAVRQGSVDLDSGEDGGSEEFDMLVANIVASVHCELADPMLSAVKAGGNLILGGIVNEREADVLAAFDRPRMTLESRAEEGDWICLAYRV